MAVDPEDQGTRLEALSASVGRLCVEIAIDQLGEDLLQPARRSADLKWVDALLADHVGHEPLQRGIQPGQGMLDPAHVPRQGLQRHEVLA